MKINYLKNCLLNFYHGKNDFAEISKNLARSENNFAESSE